MEPTSAAIVVLAVFTLLLLSAGAGLYRRVRELELATYKGVGMKFATGDDAEQMPALGAAGRMTIAVKVNRRCPVCDDVLAAVRRLAPVYADEIQFVVVTDDAALGREALPAVRVVSDPKVWRAIKVPYVPALLVIDEQGTVVHATPAGSEDVVEDNVRRVVAVRSEVAS